MPSSIASSTFSAPFEPPIANDDDDDDFDDDEEMGNIYDEPENDDDPYSLVPYQCFLCCVHSSLVLRPPNLCFSQSLCSQYHIALRKALYAIQVSIYHPKIGAIQHTVDREIFTLKMICVKNFSCC